VHPPHEQHAPSQEPGTRPARPLGYDLSVDLQVREHGLAFTLANPGALGAHLQARSNNVAGAPYSYTLGAGHRLRPTLPAGGHFDVRFHGPNGFFRRFTGSTKEPLLEVRGRRDGASLVLTLHNRQDKALVVKIADAYGSDRTVRVRRNAVRTVRVGVTATHGWYDVNLTVHGHPHYVRGLAGHVENGMPSITDPQLG
jgi:phospholipase C